jgi:hypothetical protein
LRIERKLEEYESMVQSSTAFDENRSDNNVEEGPLVSPSYVQALSLTGTLADGSGLELIDEDDGPTIPMELMGEITSDPEVRGTPSSNPSHLVPPSRTSPQVLEMNHIEICNEDDEDDGPEPPPSMMPAATFETEVTGSIPTMGWSAASKSKVDTIDEIVDGEIIKCIDRNDEDEYKLASKHSEYSREGNVEKKTAELSTKDETASHGEDFIGAHVDGIVEYVHPHLTGDVRNSEHDPENPTRHSSAVRQSTSPGVSRVPGIYSDAEAGHDVELHGAVSRISVPEALPVTAVMRAEYDSESLIVASRLDPWLRRRSMRRILVIVCIVLVGSAIAYGVLYKKSDDDTPPSAGNFTWYSCLANRDCDDGIWCNGMCPFYSFICA